MKRSPRSGFTLIELLVVIAIIAILAAILFPVFAQARAQARKTSCLSNEKQVTLAVLQYVQDFDETIPLVYAPNKINDPAGFRYPRGTRTLAWQNLVQPYAKNWQVFVCPDSGLTKTDPLTSIQPFSNYALIPSSATAGVASWIDYWWTPNATAWQGLGGVYQDNGYWTVTKSTPSTSLAAIAAPASMTLISEGGLPDGWALSGGAGYPYPTGTCGAWIPGVPYLAGYQDYREGGPIGNHMITGGGTYGKYCWQFEAGLTSGQITVAFLDGHAKTMPLRQYYTSKVTSQNQRVLQYLWPSE